ncbi:hypothetical protein L210DRAFT_725096 [Boletus edulis BED1]|uniref:Uncharacterized protein n=1 Tax=Boletus edulis BED1 TaxID=1328754 RepID=A0AAD4GB56_BOLED|nr:hypothetical protein L210DRAFT_725096 [Boletus edulis BED1]
MRARIVTGKILKYKKRQHSGELAAGSERGNGRCMLLDAPSSLLTWPGTSRPWLATFPHWEHVDARRSVMVRSRLQSSITLPIGRPEHKPFGCAPHTYDDKLLSRPKVELGSTLWHAKVRTLDSGVVCTEYLDPECPFVVLFQFVVRHEGAAQSMTGIRSTGAPRGSRRVFDSVIRIQKKANLLQ